MSGDSHDSDQPRSDTATVRAGNGTYAVYADDATV
jgi:hypothetical protein